MSFTSLDRFDLQRQISTAMRGLKKEMADVGGANTPEMKAAGRVLRAAIKKQLAKQGIRYAGPLRPGAKPKTIPSAPGEPPRRVTGRLWKSVGTEVVGGVLRVGESWFTSRLLEGGVDAALPLRSGKVRRRVGGLARRRIKIAPRPFMERAYEQAAPKMEGDFVLELRRKIEGGGSDLVRTNVSQ